MIIRSKVGNKIRRLEDLYVVECTSSNIPTQINVSDYAVFQQVFFAILEKSVDDPSSTQPSGYPPHLRREKRRSCDGRMAIAPLMKVNYVEGIEF